MAKLLLAFFAALAALGLAVSATPGAEASQSSFELANRCFALASADTGRFVAVDGPDGYRADTSRKARATAFFLEPTGLGTYLLQDSDGELLSESDPGKVDRSDIPGEHAEWAPTLRSGGWFAIESTSTERSLSAAAGTGTLTTALADSPKRRSRFAFVPTRGCRPFPEAQIGAAGRPAEGTRSDGTVFGFADVHLHITAELRAGGRVTHGTSFDRFGITRALGGDEVTHGADGSLDVTGNLLRSGLPFGTHDTHGWPTFAGWPVHDTNTHQQVYYRWLERAWKAGLRLVVAQTIEDEPLCRIEPVRSHSCDETDTIRLEIRRLRALERYVDAQSGGRGRGWFRLVYSPRKARRVIERGKLAVVIGVESSNPFGCSELMGAPQCTRKDIDRGVDKLRRWGVRSLFLAHWVDNAFAGAALEGGAKGTFINVFNRFQTGGYFETGPCPEPGQGEEVDSLSPGEMRVLARFFPATAPLAEEGMPAYPAGQQCNVKGLTKLGAYAVRRLIDKHVLIEADHLSERARSRVLEIAEARRYPLISSHNGTGGTWTPSQLRRLYALGGLAAATPDAAPELTGKIRGLRRHRSGKRYFGVPLGTDTGGFSSLPGPPADANREPLRYPFSSFDGEVRFGRQVSGQRTFDLNADGVAHYGLFADLMADVQQRFGRKPLRPLFRSGEAYLRMWRRADAGS
jgi:microsomal dipeptidase-like Zn-dependent dipeptidase